MAEGRTKILNASDFLLNGIYSPKSLFVRNRFKETMELICEKVVTKDEEHPLVFMVKVLMKNFPGTESRVSTLYCSEFFGLFGALI